MDTPINSAATGASACLILEGPFTDRGFESGILGANESPLKEQWLDTELERMH